MVSGRVLLRGDAEKGACMIDIERRDDLAVITMRHGRANALDVELCETLAARFLALRDAAKAVVLTGEEKIFSAGVDLKRLSAGGADYIRRFLPSLHRLYEAVFFHPQPVVAAINGHAIAGGAVLACCADLRIMARNGARIGVTELLVGVPFPALAFEILRFALPSRDLPTLVLTGVTHPPQPALDRGWVDALAEPAALLETAVAAAADLAGRSPSAFAQTKKQIREIVAARYAATGAATDSVVTEIWCAPDTLRCIRDYVARTLTK